MSRRPPNDYEMASMGVHRRAHLLAVLSKAHEDDERAEIERELQDIDAAICRGLEQLPEERRRRIIEHHKQVSGETSGQTSGKDE